MPEIPRSKIPSLAQQVFTIDQARCRLSKGYAGGGVRDRWHNLKLEQHRNQMKSRQWESSSCAAATSAVGKMG